MSKPRRFVYTALVAVLLASCGGDAEKSAPASNPASAQAPVSAKATEGHRSFQFDLGENTVVLEVPVPGESLSDFGRNFHYYFQLRDAAIREYLAQQYEAARDQWNPDTVREEFFRNWENTASGFARLRREVEAQAQFLAEYGTAKSNIATLTPTQFFEMYPGAGKPPIPFESVTEWNRFVQMFPDKAAVERLLERFPTTVEEAWNLHGDRLLAQAFGNEWALAELARRSPEIAERFGDDTAIGPLFADTASTFGRLTDAANTRAQVLAELRNRLALANVLESIEFADAADQKLFLDQARSELAKPLPTPLEGLNLLPATP